MSEFLPSHSWQVWVAHHMGLLSFRETPQAEEMGQQGPYEVQQREIQSPAPGKKQAHAPVQTVWADCPDSCFAEKALEVHQVHCDPEPFLCGNDSQ